MRRLTFFIFMSLLAFVGQAQNIQITFTVDADAEIWINDQKKAVRTWSGQLTPDAYEIECKQANHEPVVLVKEINPDMDGQTIKLPAPKPINGSLNVESTPSNAKIYIDNKEMGSTPKLISELLIGTHTLRLVKDDYADYTENITIEKGECKQVKASLNVSSTLSANLSKGLVAYYPFDGDTKDYSGKGNHGTIVNGNKVTPTTGINGKSNGAYMFKGGRVEVPNSQSLKFSKECTFSAFVKPTQTRSSDNQTCQCVIAKRYDQVGITFMQFYLENNKITMDWGIHGRMNPTRQWVSQNRSVGLNGNHLNQWVHMVLVVDNDKAKFYLNGQFMYEQTVNTPSFFTYINDQKMCIGQNSANWYGLQGAIDEVRVYNRALSQSEIQELYKKTSLPIAAAAPIVSTDKLITQISDDFNGDYIKSQYWKPVGDVKVSNGNLVISQSQTDKDMSLTTTNLTVPDSKKIVIERKFLNHRANNYYYGGYDIRLNGDEKMAFGVHYYYGSYEKRYGTKISSNLNNKEEFVDLCNADFDKWNTEKVIVDFGAGTLSYYLNNVFITTRTVPGLASKKMSNYDIRFHSYGWWTGHYSNMEYIRISDM